MPLRWLPAVVAVAAMVPAAGCSSSSSDAPPATPDDGDARPGDDATTDGARAEVSSDAAADTTSDGAHDGGHDGGHDGSGDGPRDTAAAADAGADARSDGAGLTAPAPAGAFTHLVFEDDFTTTDTIAPSKTASSGFKWYWSFDVPSAPLPWSVDPARSAASVANGNHGGGPNASPAGGILTLDGPGGPNDALITVPGWALNDAAATAPAAGDGNWQHGYFEAYLQFKIDGNASTDPAGGWPAFWSWSVEGLKGYGFGSSGLAAPNQNEIDFVESYGTIFGNTPGNWTATMHQWPANASDDGHTQRTDDEWHTYGCLWTSTGAGTGEVKFYLDDVQVDATVATGAGHTQFSLESMHQFLILGTGKSWDLNVDWVRVWQ